MQPLVSSVRVDEGRQTSNANSSRMDLRPQTDSIKRTAASQVSAEYNNTRRQAITESTYIVCCQYEHENKFSQK